jgi:hypothetical protein
MNKKIAIILIIIAFLIGAGSGFFLTNYFWSNFMGKFYSTSLSAQTGMDVQLLKSLRSNNVTNAIDLLEIELDSSIVGLGVYLNNVPQSKRDSIQIKMLQRAKEYRSQFPYKEDSVLSERMISNAFLLVNVQTNK